MRQLILLSVIGMFLCLSTSTHAATYGGGSGTVDDPYQIWTPEQMNTIGVNSGDWGKCFKLMADIDMSIYTGTQYNIIGNSTTKFTGTFDGNHHKISNLNYTTAPDVVYIGVFGCGYNATIKDLGVENVNFFTVGYLVGGLAGYLEICSITNCYTTGTINSSCTAHDCYAGGLTGWQRNGSIIDCRSSVAVTAFSSELNSYAGGLVALQYYGSIKHCCSTGAISSSSLASNSYAGGLAGYQLQASITDCYSTGSTNSTSSGSSVDSFAGGLVGCLTTNGSIHGSYSTGAVSCSSGHLSFAGGLVGEQQFTSTLISNCYSTGSVTCSSSNASSYSIAGGLVGDQGGGVVTACYSTGTVQISGLAKPVAGGLIGMYGNVINCFWDSQTSGLDTSAGGHERTTAQLKQSANYIAWNTPAQTYWTIDEGVDYPRLSWESQPATPLAAQVFSDFIPGAGITSDPYRISTPQQLNIIGLFPDQWDKVFRLENDIDLSTLAGTEFNRIGVSETKAFTGTFDGSGHVISNLTYRTTSAIYYVGMFGFTQNATIKNLVLEDVNLLTGGITIGGLTGSQSGGSITNCTVTGTVACSSVFNCYAGGLVGKLHTNGSATYCVCRVSVNCISSGTSSWAGGIVGEAYESSSLTSCISTGNVYSSSSNSYVGGLVGESDGPINNCCSTGEVNSSSSSSYSRAGGLAGMLYYGTCTNCYSMSAVTSNSSSSNAYAGGLIGYMAADISKVKNCYSAGSVGATGKTVYQGGLLGYKSGSGTVTACFWDKETSGRTSGVGSGSSGGIIGKTAAQMKTLSTFTSAGWDFTGESANGTADIWTMRCEGMNYPRLSWQSIPEGDFVCPDGVDGDDLNYLALRWLRTDCVTTSNCEGTDLNSDGSVDLNDYTVFAENWMKGNE